MMDIDAQQMKDSIGVLMGGVSSEREISLKSGEAVFSALCDAGLNVKAIDITSENEADVVAQLRASDIKGAFIALHGRFGEDGQIQRVLQNMGLWFTGSGVQASWDAFDKGVTQNLLKKFNITVAPYVTLSRTEQGGIDHIRSVVGAGPLVIKPCQEGSSIGVNIVLSDEDMQPALEEAWQYGQHVIVEKYIKGRELTVGIIDGTPLPVIEVRANKKFFDYQAKYEDGFTEYIVPADITAEVAQKVQQQALEVFYAVGCRDLARIDFILDETGEAYTLEINTIPGFTEKSLLPKAARHMGISFQNLCLKILYSAYGTQKEKNISDSAYHH